MDSVTYNNFKESLPPREAWIEITVTASGACSCRSLPPREAWIEILSTVSSLSIVSLSLPPREAWIEIITGISLNVDGESLPPREAWIEMVSFALIAALAVSRFPRGKRGLKSMVIWAFAFLQQGRFPRGKRGLKSMVIWAFAFLQQGRFPRGKRGLKYFTHLIPPFRSQSLPPREAWIEIPPVAVVNVLLAVVASPAGSVD